MIAALAAAITVAVALAAPARAAQTINVTSIADTVDPSPANGFCELPCTLRGAIQTANGAGSPGADTIMVPAGVYNRTVGGADGADPAATGDLDVTGALTITGANQSTTTVDAKGLERGFDIAPGVTATIAGLTITGGLASDGFFTTTGGGIRVGESAGGAATLTLNDVTLRANSARHGSGVATEAAGAVLTLNRVSVLDNLAAAGSSEGGGVNEYAGGTVAINNSLIKGNAAISGAGVTDDGGGNITITDSTVTENHTTGSRGQAGGVYETGGGNVTITRSRVSKNTSSSAGGISEDGGGTVTILDSTVSENSATTGFADGGGVQRDGGGTVTIRGSTIVGNTAGTGAGIQNYGAGGTFEVTNTTISGNSATTIDTSSAGSTGRGGGIQAQGAGTLQLTNVTLRNNLAEAGASEIDNCGNPPFCNGTPQTITLRNSIVAGAATNCAGPITSGGYNLDSGKSCAFAATGDLVDKDPLLGPLADNGGPTFTHAVLDGSPVIDEGDPATCPPVDQRGVLRPQGEACDIGAYERGLGTRQCKDGFDNDGDGDVDFPADQGCASAVDATEAPDPPECSDRIDNDADGRTNFPDDQGCASAADATEAPDPPQCSDRLDNDGDGRANFPADPGCESAMDGTEAPDPPRTSILSDPDVPNWEGGYLDSVSVRVVATGGPGGPAPETRCVLDPASAPRNFDDMPKGCPYLDGAKIKAPGTHTVYAASRAPGATEAVGSRVFRVVPYPVTKILSGPTGFTDSLPTFAFTDLPNGGKFRCRMDGGPFEPCTSPKSYYNLPAGPHTFTVRAEMANGAVDLNPPSRTFNQGVTTRVASCSGLVAYRPDTGSVCTVLKAVCPAGSRCDVKTTVNGTEQDGGVATAFAIFNRSPLYYPDGTSHGPNRADAFFAARCYSKGPSKIGLCPGTDEISYYGPDPDMEIRCGTSGSLILVYGERVPGPDDKRRVTCTSTLTIRPVPGVTAAATGTVVGTALPSAGTLVVEPRGQAPFARVAARRKAKPSPFKTVTIKVKKARRVRIPLKLSRAAKTRLRRNRRLTLRIRLTFKPVRGEKTIRKQRITLTLPPCKLPKRLPKSGRLPSCH